MKLPFNLMKLIGFVIACGIISRCIEYYIVISRYSTYSIICGISINVIFIYVIYKGFVE